MITSVIRADVTYHLTFISSASASAKASIATSLSANLGLKHAETDTSDIRGTGLYWGVRDDGALAQLNKDGTLDSLGYATTRGADDRLKPKPVLTHGGSLQVDTLAK